MTFFRKLFRCTTKKKKQTSKETITEKVMVASNQQGFYRETPEKYQENSNSKSEREMKKSPTKTSELYSEKGSRTEEESKVLDTPSHHINITNPSMGENSDEKLKASLGNVNGIYQGDDTFNSSVSTKHSINTNTHYSNASNSFGESDVSKYIEHYMGLIKKCTPQYRHSLEEQIIKDCINKKTSRNYLLNLRWAHAYTNFLSKNSGKQSPGPIHNEELKIKMERESVREDQDYVVVNEIIWRVLSAIYGGGPEIQDSVTAARQIHINNTSSKQEKLKPEIGNSFKEEEVPPSAPLKKKLEFNMDPVGLFNDSYHCFINSCLQCLFTFPKLNRYFFEENYKHVKHSRKKTNFKYCKAYQELYKIMMNARAREYINPLSFKNYAKKYFDPEEQHDCQEYLRHLLSELQDELNPIVQVNKKKPAQTFTDPEIAWNHYTKHHTSIIDNLFSGMITSTVICHQCKHESPTFDPFLDISVPIVNNNKGELQDCLDSFMEEEEIEQYDCEKCKTKSKALRKMIISQPPEILVVHLKRFKLFPQKRKISEKVKFPLENFDIASYCSKGLKKTQYDLKALIMHKGDVDSGHYFSICQRGGQWYLFNDEEISDLSESDVERTEAYLLWYQRIQNEN